ncbi:hypothetical protein C8R44DRAFT_887490 [Mycena epipterygia]|nr:hypothetical protein C8R44DRAFT_887490 [Mycena epipterygia]
MCIKELQAYIEKVSANIKRQKKVLKQLEHSKSAAQCHINALLDPVARLPFEILLEIFIQCLPTHQHRFWHIPVAGASYVPMLLLNICNAWTEIALSTPALWASIHISFPTDNGFNELVAIWLKCACNHPLCLSLHNIFNHGFTTLL